MWKGGGCHLPAYLGLPLVKCAFKRGEIVIMSDMIYPLEALQLLVWTEKRICTQEEIWLPCEIRGTKTFTSFDFWA
jgi:hypothetical protein